MRWEGLFADLSGELAAAEAGELAAEVRERVQIELARVHLADRLRGARDRSVLLIVHGGEQVDGNLAHVGPDWVLVSTAAGDAIVPLAAVRQAGAVPDHVTPAGLVAARLSLASALRRLSRERRPVWLTSRDGARLHGTIDRVGADHLDLAEHPPGEPRRDRAVTAHWTVPLDAVAVVRASG